MKTRTANEEKIKKNQLHNAESIALIEKYKSITGKKWGDVASALGVSSTSLGNWRTGVKPIARTNQKHIVLATAAALESDPLKKKLNEEWDKLSDAEKYDTIAYVTRLNESRSNVK